MKLFVYEHITSGALADQALPDSLVHEGNKMLSAVLHDCYTLLHLKLIMLRDARLSNLVTIQNNNNHYYYRISNMTDFHYLWSQCLVKADAVLIIAPETGNILAKLQQQATEMNKIILGCTPSAIELTTHKLNCAQRLAASHGITVPPNCLASDWSDQYFVHTDGYVVKPIDGAGCVDTLLFDTASELEHYLIELPSERLQQCVVQAYIKGSPASLSLLVSFDDVEVLALNKQQIRRDNNILTFEGCIVNGLNSLILPPAQALQLAQHIQRAISGLWGFIGVDIIVTEHEVFVVDINPRLTTSYVGLQQSLALNPMERLFNMKKYGLATLPTITQRQAVAIYL